MDLTLSTESPLVSEAPAVSALRVSVSPRRARVGRRTAFRFRVSSSAGGPVAGAFVRFAGRRLHVGRAGEGVLRVRLHHAGRYLARVTAAGFPARSVSVIVRR
jgi:hypothetical protein